MSLWINGEWRPGRGPGFSKQDPVNLKVVWQGEACLLYTSPSPRD